MIDERKVGYRDIFNRRWITVGGDPRFINKFYYKRNKWYLPRWALEKGIWVGKKYENRKKIIKIIIGSEEKVIILPRFHKAIIVSQKLNIETFDSFKENMAEKIYSHRFSIIIRTDTKWDGYLDNRHEHLYEWEYKVLRSVIRKDLD